MHGRALPGAVGETDSVVEGPALFPSFTLPHIHRLGLAALRSQSVGSLWVSRMESTRMPLQPCWGSHSLSSPSFCPVAALSSGSRPSCVQSVGFRHSWLGFSSSCAAQELGSLGSRNKVSGSYWLFTKHQTELRLSSFPEVCFLLSVNLLQETLILSQTGTVERSGSAAVDYIPVTLSKSVFIFKQQRYPPLRLFARNSTLLLRLLPGINASNQTVNSI